MPAPMYSNSIVIQQVYMEFTIKFYRGGRRKEEKMKGKGREKINAEKQILCSA